MLLRTRYTRRVPNEDLTTWLLKKEAAEAIGVTTKTIERFVKEGKIQQTFGKRPPLPARVSLLHPGDVERVRGERNREAPPFVLRGEAPTDMEVARRELSDAVRWPHREPVYAPQDAFLAHLAKLAEDFSPKSEAPSRTSHIPLTSRVYLTIPEAAALAGLPVSYIRKLIKEDRGLPMKLKVGRSWRVRRSDVEAL